MGIAKLSGYALRLTVQCRNLISEHKAEELKALLNEHPFLIHTKLAHTDEVLGEMEIGPLQASVVAAAALDPSQPERWKEESQKAYEVTKILLEAGADPEYERLPHHSGDPDKKGTSLAHQAAELGGAAALKALLEHDPRAALERDDQWGSTPLQVAVYSACHYDREYIPNRAVRLYCESIKALAPYSDTTQETPFIDRQFTEQQPASSILTLAQALGKHRDKKDCPLSKAFEALAQAGHDVNTRINDPGDPERHNKSPLQIILDERREFYHERYTKPGESIEALLYAGAHLDTLCADGVPFKQWVKSHAATQLASLAYSNVDYDLKDMSRTIFWKAEQEGPAAQKTLMEYLIQPDHNKICRSTPFARALAAYGHLPLWFSERNEALHGSKEARISAAVAVERLLPPHLSGGTGLIQITRNEDPGRPQDSATVNYFRGTDTHLNR